MRKRVRCLNKICQRCRGWKKKNEFQVIKNGEFKRMDRLCIPCRAFRDATMAIVTHGNGRCPTIRAKELALIPSPFTRSVKTEIDYSPLAWSDCV